MYSRIAGTGSYLPEKIVTNADLERLVDTSDEWIRSRTGISQRHVVAEGETTTDLAEHAARRAMEAAGAGTGQFWQLLCEGGGLLVVPGASGGGILIVAITAPDVNAGLVRLELLRAAETVA